MLGQLRSWNNKFEYYDNSPINNFTGTLLCGSPTTFETTLRELVTINRFIVSERPQPKPAVGERLRIRGYVGI